MLLGFGHPTVTNLGRLGQIAVEFRLFRFHPKLFHFPLQIFLLGQKLLLALPARLQFADIGAPNGDLGFNFFNPGFGLAVLGILNQFLFERLLLHLQPPHRRVGLTERGRPIFQLQTPGRGRLVNQVNRLVGQKPVGDVATREIDRRHNRPVGDVDAVMRFVLRLQAAQDSDGVLGVRLLHVNRLEATGQGLVAFHIFLIFFERRGANRPEFTARQSRL